MTFLINLRYYAMNLFLLLYDIFRKMLLHLRNTSKLIQNSISIKY